MKRYILLIGIVFLLSGCSANYDLEIYNNKVIEEFSFYDNPNKIISESSEDEELDGVEDEILDQNISYKTKIDNFFKENAQAFKNSGNQFLDKEIINKDSNYGIKFSYEYSNANYNEAYIPSTFVKYFNYLTEKDTYILSTGEGMLETVYTTHKDLDKFTIHLKTNHKVKNNNADRVDGYNYYWDVNRFNYRDKSVYVELYKDKHVFNYENEFVHILIGIGVALFAGVIAFGFMRTKSKKNNKI